MAVWRTPAANWKKPAVRRVRSRRPRLTLDRANKAGMTAYLDTLNGS